MKTILLIITIFFTMAVALNKVSAQPYSGTIFIDSTIITSSDVSTIVSTTYTGRGLRTVYDRRIPGWTTINAYVFNIVWDDGLTSEAQVNPEFGSIAAATTEATKYGLVVGRLPTCLRADVRALWIHRGTQPFGGGNKSLLIHTGQSAIYEAQGILEETLVHEASHTSLDSAHARSPGWIVAQAADNRYISAYAAANPTTEDIAESFLPWLAVRQCSTRISQRNFNTIMQTIPNRIAYFDNQNFNMYPICVRRMQVTDIANGAEKKTGCQSVCMYPHPFSTQTTLRTDNLLRNATLTIYNPYGQTVKQIHNISGQTVVLNRENLATGLYFVRLTDSDKLIALATLVITD